MLHVMLPTPVVDTTGFVLDRGVYRTRREFAEASPVSCSIFERCSLRSKKERVGSPVAIAARGVRVPGSGGRLLQKEGRHMRTGNCIRLAACVSLSALVFVLGWGQTTASGQNATAPAGPAATAQPTTVALSDADSAAARTVFFDRCAGCHGTLRKGATGPHIQ